MRKIKMKTGYVYLIWCYKDLDLNEIEIVRDGHLKNYVSDMYKHGRVSRLPKDEEDALDVLESEENYIVLKKQILD